MVDTTTWSAPFRWPISFSPTAHCVQKYGPTTTTEPEKPPDFAGIGAKPTVLSFADMMHQLICRKALLHPETSPSEATATATLPISSRSHRDGFVECVEANLEHTEIIINNSSITHVHMTGGTATHDAIVWGQDLNQQEANAQPYASPEKPMTSEFGCITPWLICSGAKWRKRNSASADSSPLPSPTMICSIVWPPKWSSLIKIGPKQMTYLKAAVHTTAS